MVFCLGDLFMIHSASFTITVCTTWNNVNGNLNGLFCVPSTFLRFAEGSRVAAKESAGNDNNDGEVDKQMHQRVTLKHEFEIIYISYEPSLTMNMQ